MSCLGPCRCDTQTPDWVREMVLLEVYPAYFPGGLAGDRGPAGVLPR